MRRYPTLLAVLLATCLAHAGPVSATERGKIIDGVVDHLQASYIDAGQAGRLGVVLRQADFSGALDDAAFAKAVTALMQSVTKDPHLRLTYRQEKPPQANSGGPTAAQIARWQASLREDNYGIERVERLPANIGYLKTTSFAPAAEAGPAIAAAMTLLTHTSALIIDLRENGGGDPDTVLLMASYFFDQRTRLGDFYTREGDVTDQQWTYPAVAGSHFGAEKDVYVLTSKQTFSGAEGLAYALRNLKRAVIVGETTRGGAHPSRIKPVDDHYTLLLPVSVVRDAVTGTDWEGTGVAPDVPVPAGDALVRTQQLILNKMLAGAPTAERQAEIRQRLQTLDG